MLIGKNEKNISYSASSYDYPFLNSDRYIDRVSSDEQLIEVLASHPGAMGIGKSSVLGDDPRVKLLAIDGFASFIKVVGVYDNNKYSQLTSGTNKIAVLAKIPEIIPEIKQVVAVPEISAKEQDTVLTEHMEKLVQSRVSIIEKLASHPIIVSAVESQNSSGLTLEEVKLRDAKWISGQAAELIKTVQSNECGRLLNKTIRSNKMLYTEAFACDRLGAVVGEHPTTSDYWQGDEQKFTRCYESGRVFIGDLENDQSTGSYSVQVSVPIKKNNKTIGVLVVGLRNIKEKAEN